MRDIERKAKSKITCPLKVKLITQVTFTCFKSKYYTCLVREFRKLSKNSESKVSIGLALWLTGIIPATREAEIGRIEV
jgi:hypothetical protein